VIKFVGATNLTNILSLSEPQQLTLPTMVMQLHKLKLWVGFAAPPNLITNLTNVEVVL
jgi:hypothetical protein